jgi:hypothetical protein
MQRWRMLVCRDVRGFSRMLSQELRIRRDFGTTMVQIWAGRLVGIESWERAAVR